LYQLLAFSDRGRVRSRRNSPQRKSQVVDDSVEPCQAALIAKSVHRLADASGRNSRDRRRIVWATIVTARMLRGEFLVHAELLLQVAVARPETGDPFAKSAHTVSPSHTPPYNSA
jgi:hypothetical protein